MEKTSQELLRSVHKNAEMGKISIPQVLEAAEDPGLRHALHHQLREYEVIAHQSEELLERRGAPAADPGELKEFLCGMMVRMRTMGDRSSSRLAEMMIRGSTMGTIQMARQIHSCEAADGAALSLAHRLLRAEERYIEELKRFL